MHRSEKPLPKKQIRRRFERILLTCLIALAAYAAWLNAAPLIIETLPNGTRNRINFDRIVYCVSDDFDTYSAKDRVRGGFRDAVDEWSRTADVPPFVYDSREDSNCFLKGRPR